MGNSQAAIWLFCISFAPPFGSPAFCSLSPSHKELKDVPTQRSDSFSNLHPWTESTLLLFSVILNGFSFPEILRVSDSKYFPDFWTSTGLEAPGYSMGISSVATDPEQLPVAALLRFQKVESTFPWPKRHDDSGIPVCIDCKFVSVEISAFWCFLFFSFFFLPHTLE